MYGSSEEFEIQPDPTFDCGVSCPSASEKNPHRLITSKRCCCFFSVLLDRSISYLQVTMTYMRAWMSLKSGQIRLLVSMATDRAIMEKRCCNFFSAVFIRSCSYLLVMMTCMRAQRSSKFGQIRLLTSGWRSGAVVRASDFGPRGPLFEPRPVHISLWL